MKHAYFKTVYDALVSMHVLIPAELAQTTQLLVCSETVLIQ